MLCVIYHVRRLKQEGQFEISIPWGDLGLVMSLGTAWRKQSDIRKIYGHVSLKGLEMVKSSGKWQEPEECSFYAK